MLSFFSLIFEILRFFDILKKKHVIFNFFIIIKSVIIDIIQKSKKIKHIFVEHTFTFRMIYVL